MTSESTFPWTWSTAWIEVGIAALVVLTLQGVLIAERTGHNGIVFGVVWNMTEKPGLGESIAAVLVGYAVGAVLALLVTRSAREPAYEGTADSTHAA
jgi:hypothetical protein